MKPLARQTQKYFGETLAFLVHADPGSSNSRDANEEDQQGVY